MKTDVAKMISDQVVIPEGYYKNLESALVSVAVDRFFNLLLFCTDTELLTPKKMQDDLQDFLSYLFRFQKIVSEITEQGEHLAGNVVITRNKGKKATVGFNVCAPGACYSYDVSSNKPGIKPDMYLAEEDGVYVEESRHGCIESALMSIAISHIMMRILFDMVWDAKEMQNRLQHELSLLFRFPKIVSEIIKQEDGTLAGSVTISPDNPKESNKKKGKKPLVLHFCVMPSISMSDIVK